jgi:hypothetical protein
MKYPALETILAKKDDSAEEIAEKAYEQCEKVIKKLRKLEALGNSEAAGMENELSLIDIMAYLNRTYMNESKSGILNKPEPEAEEDEL